MKARYYILCVLALAATACLRDPDAPNNQPDTPTLSVDDASLTRVSMLVEGSFGADMTDITTYGVELSETLFEDGGDPQVLVPQELVGGNFSIGVTGLKSNSTYYMRSFIGNGHSKLYSKTLTQKTPESSVASVSDVTLQDGFNLVATIEDDGGREVYDVGFVWGAENDVKKIRREKRVPGTLSADGKSFSMPVSEVGAGTYYILAYVEDDRSGTGFSRITYQLSMRDDDEVNIEDPNFKAYLLAHHDRNKDGKISYGELKVIEFVETSTDEIRSVREIEGMPELFRVMLKGSEPRKGKLTAMPVKQNSKLRTLDCSNNNIASLDLSGNKELEYLDCSGNGLTALSVANNIRLDALDVSDNQLTELDLSNNSGLRSLNISGNKFPSQDYSGMIALKELNCRNNPQMDTLYLSINQEFTLLEVGDNTTIKYVDAPEGQQPNEIWYTTTDGNIVSPNRDASFGEGVTLVSNTYENGQGIMRFDGNVTMIGIDAFSSSSKDNPGHLKTVAIPEGCLSIEEDAFQYQSLEEIDLPSSLVYLGRFAFYGCSSLKEIILPDNLAKIGELAFGYCELLTEVTIPQSVENLAGGAFCECTGIERFLGRYASDSGRALIDGETLLAVAPAGLTSYTVPDGVRVISNYVFGGFSNLLEIVLPNNLLSIGIQAFTDCSGLKQMYIPESVTEIRAAAFRACTSLEFVNIPPLVTQIPGELFTGDSSLREIVIPDGVTQIGSYAFRFCSSLTEITIPALVQSIGGQAFYRCSGLESITVEPVTPPTGGNAMFDDTNCPIYVPKESVQAYKSASYWSNYESRIQAMPSDITASKYLTFTSTGTTRISLLNMGDNAPLLYYSTDHETWNEWDYSELTFSQGSPLYLCGDNPNGISSGTEKYSQFRYASLDDSPYTVSGDIMSLVNKDEDVTTIPSDYCFYSLFMDNPGLTAAPSLPATTLAPFCYQYLFYGCKGLTSAPSLPATTMAIGCYSNMFENCESLTQAPELKATTLAKSCYERMFFGCSNLASAPALPATTLAEYCYSGMFFNDRSLLDAPELAATTLVEGCYSDMFSGCENLSYVKCLATDISATNCTDGWLYWVASEGTFVKAAAMREWTVGEDGIPQGWQRMNDDGSADVYPVKYLTFSSEGTTTVSLSNTYDNAPTVYYSYDLDAWYEWDYSQLSFSANKPLYFCGDNPSGFSASLSEHSTFVTSGSAFAVSGDIMSLVNYETDLSAIPADACFSYLFQGCANLTSGPSLPAVTLTLGCYYCLFNDCTSLASAPQLPATSLDVMCYGDMFNGCTSLTAAPTLSATTLYENCYHQMFAGCTSITTAPELPATTMASNCYSGMFFGCTGITSAPELPATTLVIGCYQHMFYGCTKLSYIKCLATDITAEDCLSSWVYNVASTGTFVKAPNAQWTTGVSGIPNGWATVNDGDVPSGGNEGTSEEDWN